ncbi:hypothetical protein ColLi_08268 [Colletotrichum liriopes]|uniref:Uncharacterized protein n=1 Tax=Colletotrichum liriopes TaxID=708192 RepID=A0AA37GQR9_9PEZI|nr:hypothetical protein ColLi_08268 [Colletotrichum liriopes]
MPEISPFSGFKPTNKDSSTSALAQCTAVGRLRLLVHFSIGGHIMFRIGFLEFCAHIGLDVVRS